MLQAFRTVLVLNVPCGDGRGTPRIFSSVLTILCRRLRSELLPSSYQTVMQLVRTLPMVPLKNVVRMGGRRECRLCWAFLVREVVLVVHVSSLVMCSPRNLVLSAISTAQPLMLSGECAGHVFLKSTLISFVLSTFRDRLLWLHHSLSRFTSSL